jgi:O-antigen ligase
MLRLTLLWLAIGFLSIYAFKDWYKSLCGLILLMAFLEHPDMPKSMFGIQGANPFNILLAIIMVAWFINRKKEGLVWDMPRRINVLLVLYLAVILVGFYRMLNDTSGLIQFATLTEEEPPTTANLWSEYLVNTVKWVIPGLLLFDGCNSRSRFVTGLVAVLGIYFLLAVQIIKWMPLGAAVTGESLTARSLKILVNEIGYHRVNLSMMLAGASWAIFSTRPLTKDGRKVLLIIGASLIVLLGQALTGGRAGYGTWAVVGLLLCVVKWRKYLFVAPVALLLIIAVVPGASERMKQGFDDESRDSNPLIERSKQYKLGSLDLYTITAGRNVAWPYVIDKIADSSLTGHGREAMQRTGIATFLWQELGEGFPHPHNAYLQWLLDNGLLGFVPVLAFYVMLLKYSISLFRDDRNPVFISIGGVSLSLILTLLVASVGSQSFYPREGAVGMWCAIGLMLRIFVQRSGLEGGVSSGFVAVSDEELWRRQ